MTPDQIFEAARLWNLHMNTLDIAERLRVPEAWDYGQMRPIRVAAMALRNAQLRVSA